MSCWEFPPRRVQLRVVVVDQCQSGATQEDRLVGGWGWFGGKVPGVVWGFGYHPWNFVCLAELFQSVLAVLCPLLSAGGARRLGLVGHVLHGAAEMHRMAASWPIVWGVGSNGSPVDVLQTDCTCWKLCCRCCFCWWCCSSLRRPMRGRVIGQVDLDRCLSHCDEETDEGDCVGGNKHRADENPTGIGKSNDERFFILVASRYAYSTYVSVFFFFFFDRFFFCCVLGFPPLVPAVQTRLFYEPGQPPGVYGALFRVASPPPPPVSQNKSFPRICLNGKHVQQLQMICNVRINIPRCFHFPYQTFETRRFKSHFRCKNIFQNIRKFIRTRAFVIFPCRTRINWCTSMMS